MRVKKGNIMKKLVVCLLAVMMVLSMSFAVISVSAADIGFAPSVEAKPVPEIIVTNGIGAVVHDGKNDVNVSIDDIFSASYQTAKDQIAAGTAGDNADVYNSMIKAYDELKDKGLDKAIKDLEKFVNKNLKIENPTYFVSHVFELNIDAADVKKLSANPTVTITFDNADINAEDGKFVVAYYASNKWQIVPADDVKVTAETVEVTFDDLCPVAFIHVDGNPASGDSGNSGWGCSSTIGMGAIVVVSACGAALLFKKKEN